MFRLVLICICLAAPDLYARSFGYEGRDGQSGHAGRDGRDGSAVVIVADGTSALHDISGSDGLDGRQGENGYNATNCNPPHRPSYNLEGEEGGNGGRGGQGGRGGHGGAVTVYYQNIDDLNLISIRGEPGRGGRGGWGGRGGDGCRCNEYQWTIPDPNGGAGQTYQCTNGDRGNDASSGSNGQDGGYGQVTLINQLEPLAPEQPSISIDMADLENGTRVLSRNYWQSGSGASVLFAPGTRIASSYKKFTGRTEQATKIRWNVERPITDFSRWTARLALDDEAHPRLYFPNNLWFEAQWMDEGDTKVLEINKVVKNTEIAYISLTNFANHGLRHTVSVRDSKGMAHILNNELHVEYWSVVNGQWKRHFKEDVGADKFEVTPNEIKIKVGELGIEDEYLELGTRAYVKVYVKRSLGNNSVRYVLDSNYTIKIAINVGDLVEAKEDANLYSGNSVVGSVNAGDQFTVRSIQGDWIALKDLDGTNRNGWIQRAKLKKPEN